VDCGAIGQDKGTDGERVQNPGTTQLSVSTVMGTLQNILWDILADGFLGRLEYGEVVDVINVR
jgi:hypothetical protein